jgi:lambda family phage portal protein
MARTLNIDGQQTAIRESWLDRAISAIAPIYGARRYKARLFHAAAGAYVGASRTRRSMMQWNPNLGDADADTLYDLPTLRTRSRDLLRNAPLASGAINTVVTNVVGTGLMVRPEVDRTALGMSEEEADAWEQQTEREWKVFANTIEIDAARTLDFIGLQELAFRSVLESGDVLAVLPSITRQNSPYRTKVQLVEGDRLSNPNDRMDDDTFAGGVEKDAYGAPIRYHISSIHPGSSLSRARRKWTPVDAYGKNGRRNVLHLFKPLRPGQSRGIPYLAPVMEPLKQIDRYTEAEIMAAVVAGMYTVFIKSEAGDGSLAPMTPTSETGGSTADEDYKLASGAIVGLAPGEDITTANPGRPNTAFDPFVQAVLRQIGVGLELPFEILIKHFTASYSAARAAILEAWKFFLSRRRWLVTVFCQPVYELFLFEAVVMGRITAPGFLSDPALRMAYSGAYWIGPSKGMIQEEQEVNAAGKRIELEISTREYECAQLLGLEWDRVHAQSVKEKKMRDQAGLVDPNAPAPGRPQTPSLADLQDQPE